MNKIIARPVEVCVCSLEFRLLLRLLLQFVHFKVRNEGTNTKSQPGGYIHIVFTFFNKIIVEIKLCT